MIQAALLATTGYAAVLSLVMGMAFRNPFMLASFVFLMLAMLVAIAFDLGTTER